MFDEFRRLGLVDLASRMLNKVAFMFNFTIRVCKLIYVHWKISYPCLLVSLSYDICFDFFFFFFFVIYSVCEYFWFNMVEF